MEQVMGVISAIRTMRGEMEVPPSRQITALLSAESQEGAAVLEAAREQIQNLARLGALEIGVNIEKPADAAVQPAGQVQVFLPLKGLVDVAEELKRLTKEIAKLDKEVELFSKKLSNPSFVDRAPADIVEKEKAKLAEVIAKKEILVASFDKINALA